MQQTMRHSLKQLFLLLFRHLLSFVTIAAILQITISYLGGYLLKLIFRLALLLGNQTHLDLNNISYLMRQPDSLLAFLLFALCFAALFFIELSVLIYVIYARQLKKEISYGAVIRQALGRLRHLFGLSFFYFLGYIAITIPISGLVMQSSLTNGLRIPDFITGEFLKTWQGTVLVVILAILLFYLNLRLIYATPLMMIKDQSFVKSLRESWQMTQVKKWKLLLTFAIFGFVLGLISVGLISVFIEAARALDPSGNSFIVQALLLSILKFIAFTVIILSKVGTLIILVDQVVAPELADSLVLIEPRHRRHRRRIFLLVFSLIFFKIGENAFLLASQTYQSQQAIIGHRGYVEKGVENTIQALEAAAENGATMVELDVQMTKDQRLVVMHDSNLQRLAGINREVWDMTYDELVGLTLSQGDYQSQLPSFEEFVKRAQELDINLLIELKPHGKEPDNYAQLIVEKLQELGISSRYPVMSLNHEAIDAIESLNPAIKTGYVIPLQFGPFAKNEVDFYVLEAFSYTSELASQAHQEGKEVYVWTINDEEEIQNFLYRPVDGIITDKLETLKEIQYGISDNQTYFERVGQLMAPQF